MKRPYREAAQAIHDRLIASRKLKISTTTAKVYAHIAADLLIENNAQPGL